ncbi:hypothetical protein W97_01317 [Coniosporium apollinis CBS 100218]|uniref:glucan endo-1,3-beta-D-glucosidase n=1 Tax=Coniosporium apollinis (strain CBS 100218) TaxID=1168221 RepID=R7YJQ9_CONA1|nr:uncharacterized protein W97_01317 [Coniosporium apollinis CBS 100218]EON62098.1 hypothetical protein W97_01317 [Coniosporium apollinis CBS 100218]
MRNVVAAGAVIAATLSGAAADLCASGSELIGGNWYCQAVQKITYQGVGGSGKYNKITKMDPVSGACSSAPFSYSGSLAPLNEELSLHFRGPLQLKQFAVYTPSSGSSTKPKMAKRSPHERRHAHGHQHFHQQHKETREIQEAAEAEKRAVGDWVTATINGEVVSWVNTFGAETPAAKAVVNDATTITKTVAQATATQTATIASEKAGASAPASSAAPSPKATTASVASGDWSQVAYYEASSGTAHGVTFLNNMGGQGSGTFDYVFGNSLSYAAADAKSGASSPQVLKDMTLPSNTEITIMSDKECSGDSCGYYRPDTVAYHGFGGPSKAFFFEFSMPDDGTSGWNMNMPALWMLNAQIPRTLQYGKAECSCWTSGCAEFDIFEVLDSGNTRCKSTLHGNIKGGNSDYFKRPTSGTIKAAVVMHDDQIHIQILDNGINFGGSMPSSTISDICANDSKVLTSIFALSS